MAGERQYLNALLVRVGCGEGSVPALADRALLFPLQHFLSKTSSPDVSAPQTDGAFYLFGKLTACSGFASFWCTGNFYCCDVNPCLVLTCNLQFKQTRSKERNEILIAIQIAPSSIHPLPTLLPTP